MSSNSDAILFWCVIKANRSKIQYCSLANLNDEEEQKNNEQCRNK